MWAEHQLAWTINYSTMKNIIDRLPTSIYRARFSRAREMDSIAWQSMHTPAPIGEFDGTQINLIEISFIVEKYYSNYNAKTEVHD